MIIYSKLCTDCWLLHEIYISLSHFGTMQERRSIFTYLRKKINLIENLAECLDMKKYFEFDRTCLINRHNSIVDPEISVRS